MDLEILRFPLGPQPSLQIVKGKSFAVWDFESLGVHGPRLAWLKKIYSEASLHLYVTQKELNDFERQLFQWALDEFKKTFPAAIIEFKEAPSLPERVIEKMKEIFPKTVQQLGFAFSKLGREYLEEVSVATWLTEEWLRFFPLFLKERFPERIELFEGAQLEVFQALLDYQDFATQVKCLEGYCYLNPSLQIATVSQNLPQFARERGLYAFYRLSDQERIVEKRIEPFSARFIDHLTEFMALPEHELIQMTKQEFLSRGESIEGIEKSFADLMASEIVFRSVFKK